MCYKKNLSPEDNDKYAKADEDEELECVYCDQTILKSMQIKHAFIFEKYKLEDDKPNRRSVSLNLFTP